MYKMIMILGIICLFASIAVSGDRNRFRTSWGDTSGTTAWDTSSSWRTERAKKATRIKKPSLLDYDDGKVYRKESGTGAYYQVDKYQRYKKPGQKSTIDRPYGTSVWND